METHSKRGRSVRTSLILVLLLVAAGCEQMLGPEQFPVTQVSGSIVEGGRPVGGGFIEFIPVEGTQGRIRSARIQPDGTFHASEVPVGKTVIRLVNAPVQLRGGRDLFGNYSTTPLQREIPAQPGAPIRIDLLDEAIRYQARRTRSAGARAGDGAGGA